MKYYGWYSAQADARFGHALYRSPEGLEIKVVEAVSSPDQRPGGRWNDYVYVGELGSLIKSAPTMFDPALPQKEQLMILRDKILEGMGEQKRCRAQFSTTHKCFCGTCTTNVNTN